MRSQDEDTEEVVQLERIFHAEIYKWMLQRTAFSEEDSAELSICDLSDDYVIFSQIAAEYFKPKKLVVVSRGDKQPERYKNVFKDNPGFEIDESKKIDVSGETYSETVNPNNLGTFDLIICKEMLYDVKDLPEFFRCLKTCLKYVGRSKIICLARPKNPPVPLPDPALATWRKMTPSREDILRAGHDSDLCSDFYSASIPIKIDKQKWWKILRSRTLAAIRNCSKCPDREIRDFIQSRPTPTLQFEERIILLVLWLPTEEDKVRMVQDKEKADKYAETLD